MSQDVAPSRAGKRKARTRNALITAAQGFLSQGRTNVSIQELTDAADVGFGSFYNHFESKEALFDEAVTTTLDTYGDLLDDLVADIEDPAEIFTASFRLTGRLQRRVPESVRLMLNSGTRILIRSQGLAPRAMRDLQAAHDAGRMDVPDAELGLMAVGGALLGLLQLLETHPELDDAATTDEFTRRMLGMLGVTPARARKLCERPLPELPQF